MWQGTALKDAHVNSRKFVTKRRGHLPGTRCSDTPFRVWWYFLRHRATLILWNFCPHDRNVAGTSTGLIYFVRHAGGTKLRKIRVRCARNVIHHLHTRRRVTATYLCRASPRFTSPCVNKLWFCPCYSKCAYLTALGRTYFRTLHFVSLFCVDYK